MDQSTLTDILHALLETNESLQSLHRKVDALTRDVETLKSSASFSRDTGFPNTTLVSPSKRPPNIHINPGQSHFDPMNRGAPTSPLKMRKPGMITVENQTTDATHSAEGVQSEVPPEPSHFRRQESPPQRYPSTQGTSRAPPRGIVVNSPSYVLPSSLPDSDKLDATMTSLPPPEPTHARGASPSKFPSSNRSPPPVNINIPHNAFSPTVVPFDASPTYLSPPPEPRHLNVTIPPPTAADIAAMTPNTQKKYKQAALAMHLHVDPPNVNVPQPPAPAAPPTVVLQNDNNNDDDDDVPLSPTAASSPKVLRFPGVSQNVQVKRTVLRAPPPPPQPNDADDIQDDGPPLSPKAASRKPGFNTS
eukprot:PhF_6_TR31183/c0_g1_i1/m.45722